MRNFQGMVAAVAEIWKLVAIGGLLVPVVDGHSAC
jgi:hypothetical protein